MKRIILKAGEEYRLLRGHPWVFDNEVAAIVDPKGDLVSLEPGELVDVESSRKTYVGRALANPHSKIIARLYSPSKEGIDRGFFIHRLRKALEWRRRWYNLDTTSVRLVFGEADGLPGLIVDRFVGWPLEQVLSMYDGAQTTKNDGVGNPGEAFEGNADAQRRPLTFDLLQERLGSPGVWYAVQFLSYGMDQRRSLVLEALENLLGKAKGIIERDDTPVRSLEGLTPRAGLLQGTWPEKGICVFENQFPFVVDLLGGQKTGHFLDQRENRARLEPFVKGGTVLDLCCHTGGFSIHAARYGAQEVLAVDVSKDALAMLHLNARINGVSERIQTLEGDVFEVLRNLVQERRQFDCIVLDPPAFAKTKTALAGALRGYRDINRHALLVLKRGGFLFTCSCSQAMTEDKFKEMIEMAAAEADRRLRLVEFRYQSIDHPILVGYDESLYLKCGIYQVL
ncbi:class I SAM-dependent rRNA methyltransferase [Treponema sp. J25]|uniref:class I SAM-dependent rRNA methyltransferase n=1 Tax=Treponema sp. J25 TaxID=2094121 RepID=UPI0010432182|nr:class I SAM-dependent rRNA methyltransferase [Treponema sp. J25]TCW61681.1 class I SAM-dependent rRNA methyltransferase [Treponema sp. J25]